MTMTNCLYTVLACGALALGVLSDTSSRAGEPAPSKGAGKVPVHPSDHQVDRIGPKRSSQTVKPKPVRPFSPSLPKPLEGVRSGVIIADRNSAVLAGAASTKGGAAKAGLTIEPVENHLGFEVPGKSSTLVPSIGADRRAPGPGYVGGSAVIASKNSAVINGTGMTHRR